MFEALLLSGAAADGRAIVSLAERIDKLAALERARKALEAEQVPRWASSALGGWPPAGQRRAPTAS